MEIAALYQTTLNDRVESINEMRDLCGLGVERRNQAAVTTNWRITAEDARIKLDRLYPPVQY